MSAAPDGSEPRDARAGRGGGLAVVMRPVNHVVERLIPSALVFAIVLTFVVAALGLALTGATPAAVVTAWGDGLSGLLEFMTQMALILLLGHMLANTGPVRALLTRVARLPRSAMQAYVFVFVAAALASLVTWGLGLVVGGILAREVAAQGRERGLRLHFPLLVAAGFAGFVVWHMGYSASGPLTAATPDSFVSEHLGAPLPITETVFTTWNIVAAAVTIVAVAATILLVSPRAQDPVVELDVDARDRGVDVDDDVVTPADRIDASRLPTLLLGLLLVGYLVLHFAGGGSVTLNVVNWTFLALILLLVRSPFEVIALTKDAAGNVGEILLQFPLYAGILGIMAGTGLIELFSDALVAASTPQTFGVMAFLSAGVVNFFVPSGGGQFAIQAPIMLGAADSLGVDPSIAIMAVAYGDQWTNMIQPFWALPLLAIAGLKMRDILGYTTLVLIVSGIVFASTLLIVSS
ncbi:short-chain fatty acids transporter [Zhihengliuella halotolerans]|uniref:Short-chain fatty acids transporter n=2 Tax=Zhihengliuella halotolerans TaxID=370736 RepID=A0A4Q8AE37_9MICC|nr:short-chain fatty acids transporter [Zhihengliuella halotolerans]